MLADSGGCFPGSAACSRQVTTSRTPHVRGLPGPHRIQGGDCLAPSWRQKGWLVKAIVFDPDRPASKHLEIDKRGREAHKNSMGRMDSTLGGRSWQSCSKAEDVAGAANSGSAARSFKYAPESLITLIIRARPQIHDP